MTPFDAGRLPVRQADLLAAMEAVAKDLETIAAAVTKMAETNAGVFQELAKLVDELRARVAALEARK